MAKKNWREKKKSGHIVQGGARFPWLIEHDMVTQDGHKEEWPLPADGRRFTLAELRAFVGGSVEFLRLTPGAKLNGFLMVVNDKGRLIGLPVNSRASFLIGQTIVGNALVCPESMIA